MESNANRHLIEKEILPVNKKDRKVGMLGYFFIWVGMVVMIVAYELGGDAIDAHLLSVSLSVIFLAYFLIGIIMLFSADIGTEHGLSFSVYLRAPFGIFGTHIPSIIRAVGGAFWFGIQTYLGAIALNGIFAYLIGFDNWFVWYLVFALVQLINTALGMKAVERFADFAAPILIGISVWMYFYLDGLLEATDKSIWTFVGDSEATLMVIFIANIAMWSDLAIDVPNYSRYLKVNSGTKNFFKRNKNIFLAQMFALPVVSTVMAFLGAMAFVATGNWNPIEVISENHSGFILIVLLGLITIAQWSTNNAANLIPSALAIVNAGAPYINYPVSVFIAGIAGILTMPWLILDQLSVFLGYFGAPLATVAGIIICDYFVIRRRRLNIPDLYKKDGQYYFFKGFNPAGIITFIAAGLLSIYFLEVSFVVGLPVGFILYFLLMKYWIAPKYPQAEITSNFDDKFLSVSVNQDWIYENNEFVVRKYDNNN